MKSYREMAEEAIRRRDKYVVLRRKRIKKALVALTAFAVFTVVGVASVLIGVERMDSPNKPPEVSVGLNSDSDGKSNGSATGSEDRSTISPDPTETSADTDVSDTESESVSETTTEAIDNINPPPNNDPPDNNERAESTVPDSAPKPPKDTENSISISSTSDSEPTTPIVTEENGTTEDVPKPPETEDGSYPPILVGTLKPSIYYPETEETSSVTPDDPPITPPSYTGTTPQAPPDEMTPGATEDTADNNDPPGLEIPSAPGDPGDENDKPEEYYELQFVTRYIRENTEVIDIFDINGKVLPEKMSTYLVKGGEFDLREYLIYLTDSLGATCGESMLNSADFGDKESLTYYLNDEFRTSFNAFRIEIPEYPIPAVRSYRYYISMMANNVELNGSEIYTFDEVFDYATSLPHFKIALSYAGITDGEYDVYKTFTGGENGNYHYSFTFIPKTDDPVESFLYRNSKYVRIAGNVGLGEEYGGVYFEASNSAFEVEKNWEYTPYSEVREAFLTELEKFGVREYCEDNMVCYLIDSNSGSAYIKPIFRFYIKFTDTDGNLVYCEPGVIRHRNGYTRYYDIGEQTIIR